MANSFILILSFTSAVWMACIDRDVEIFAVKGHVYRLWCNVEENSKNNFTYTWSKNNETVGANARLVLEGSSLWVLRTEASDSGHYQCKSTNSSMTVKRGMVFSVEDVPCPRPLAFHVLLEGTTVKLSCSEENVQTLGERVQVQWWKDCKSTAMLGSEISLSNLSVSDTGNYTCMVIFRYEGQGYTASYTFDLTVIQDEPIDQPRIIHPQNATMHVKQGKEVKLECTAFTGSGGNEIETEIYWMINDSLVEIYPELQEDFTINGKYASSSLFIPKAHAEFFGVPIQCVILSPFGTDIGLVWLKQDDELKTPLILTLTLIPILLMGVFLLIFFKIDIILAYRQLCGESKTLQEQELYNAYVLYCGGNSPGFTVAANLSLKILPEVLEQQYGLRLFIHGRDDIGTEVNADVTTDVLSRSRSVVLVVPGSSLAKNEAEGSIPLTQNQEVHDPIQLVTELFSVITQSGLPVILVECDENADYTLLPEAILSAGKKEGALRWSPAVRPGGRFWKLLRYRMT